MNRHERRAAKKQAGLLARAAQPPVDPVVAFHEAGHAIARYITAPEMGYAPEDAIAEIRVTPAAVPFGESVDGAALLASQAVTVGPMFIERFGDARQRAAERLNVDLAKERLTGQRLGDFVTAILDEARKDGADVDGWLRARALIAVMGGVAEAALKRRPVDAVLASHECESDLHGFIRDCHAAQVPEDGISPLINAAVERGVHLIQDVRVLAALNAVAKRLVEHGTTNGRIAARIIRDALG